MMHASTGHVHWRGYGRANLPALVVLHGLFGSLDNWVTLCRRWSDAFHVLAFDARNHGRSFHARAMDYPMMAADLRSFLDERGISRAHLLGHSMGGKTVMEFAVTHPERVDRLVVVDIAPRGYPPGHDGIFDALCAVKPAAYPTRAEVEAALAPLVPSPAVRAFLLKNLIRDAEGRLGWKMNLPVLRREYDAIRGPVAAHSLCDRPALFIAGGRSRYILPEDREEIRRIFPHAAVFTVRSAGHWVHAEAPEDVEMVVRRFLTGH
jgi:pimeloyl-ACP methyl ester carboxylesterase